LFMMAGMVEEEAGECNCKRAVLGRTPHS
jgi:hypothetical protein